MTETSNPLGDFVSPYGTLILGGVVGSTAYGLATENSDIDRKGVFVVPTAKALSLDAAKEIDWSLHKTEPDLTAYEIAKFLRLAASGNPTVSELLWLDTYETLTALGQRLIDLREALLCTEQVKARYGGYARQQARYIQKRDIGDDSWGRASKHARHCFRLMIVGEHLLSSGQLLVNVSAHRDEIFAMGELAVTDLSAFVEAFEARAAKLDNMDSVLPDIINWEEISDFLVEIRCELLTR